MRVQNAILFGLAIAAATAIYGIVQQRHPEVTTFTVASTPAVKPVAPYPAHSAQLVDSQRLTALHTPSLSSGSA